MINLPHQVTVIEAINKIEAQQMSDEELLLYEQAIKEIKKKRGIGGRYGGDEHYKSGRDDYMTPPDIYGPLLKLFNREKFDIDVCCTKENIPANIHYTKNENGLLQKWSGLCFCNPPWNKTPKWINKGFHESVNPDTHICFVIPSNRFETGYMQDHIMNNPNALWLILPQKRGFIIPGQEDQKPIPSVGVAIAIMSPDAKKLQKEINNKNLFNATAFIGNL
jgi:hypothetical protein